MEMLIISLSLGIGVTIVVLGTSCVILGAKREKEFRNKYKILIKQ